MPDDMDWSELDDFLFHEAYLPALKTYRAVTGLGLREAMEALGKRQRLLRETQPEKFPKRPDPATEAHATLQGIGGRVRAIEAVWDGDTVHDWFIGLVAISEGASTGHAQFTETWLCIITQRDAGQTSLVNVAVDLQRRLAEQRNAEVKIPVWPPDDTAPRWWDTATSPTSLV